MPKLERKEVKAMLRIWFWVTAMIVVLYTLTIRPAASEQAPITEGDAIDGAAEWSQTMAAPIPMERDGDIVQPPSYVPHVPPEAANEGAEPEEQEPAIEEGETQETPESFGEVQQEEEETKSPVESEVPPEEEAGELVGGNDWDGSYDWYIPPEATQPYWEEQDGTAVELYSESAADADTLQGIKQSIDGIFICIMLLMSCGVVYLVCRIVWPLFNYL